jgi:sarcosine oxidase subunit gamma
MSVRLDELSTSVRIGLKGPRAAEWLQQQGCVVPALRNSWQPLGDEASSIVARLGSSEFFLEQAQPATLISRLADAMTAPTEGVYPVLREDRAFELAGDDAHDVLAQVCNVDFKNVSRSDRQLVMTLMVGVAVLVIPDDGVPHDRKWGQSPFSEEQKMGTVPGYRIWCDPSYGDYLSSSLQDVMRGA